jgi:hypothetical protein
MILAKEKTPQRTLQINHNKAVSLIKVLSRLLACSLLFAAAAPSMAAKCSGGANCAACKNCSGCGHCAKAGGTCSVCRPDLYGRASLAPSAPLRTTPRDQVLQMTQRAPRQSAPRQAEPRQQRQSKRYVQVPALWSGKVVGVSDGKSVWTRNKEFQ